MSMFIQIIFNSLETGGNLALATMGIILIFRTSSTFNYAQGAIAMFCAFIAAYFMRETGANVWLSTLVGIAGAVGVGIIIDRVVIKRSVKVHPGSKPIITLGLAIIFMGLAPMFFGALPLTYQRFAHGTQTVADANITNSGLVNISIGIFVMGLLFFVIQKTKWGLGVRATASNDVVARMMGVPTPIITMGSWAIAAAFGTMSALMIAPTVRVDFMMMESTQITALLACVLGGLGTFFGPVIAAYLIALSRNLISFYFGVSSTWANAIVYVLILCILLIKPSGLFGRKVQKKV